MKNTKNPLNDEARAFFAKQGKKGGKKLLKARGKKYFSDIAKKRWQDKHVFIPVDNSLTGKGNVWNDGNADKITHT